MLPSAITHTFVVASVFASAAYAALVQVTNFGANPGGTQMYINVPSKLATKPAVILAVSFHAFS